MIVFGGLRAKTCLDCLNWTVLALTSGKFCLLLWIMPMCWSAQYTKHCVLVLLSVCGAFSIFVTENTLCFLQSTCWNRFLSPVVYCRMVVSDQRSQPTVGVQTQGDRAHTWKVPAQVVQICLRSLGNANLARPVHFTVSRRASEVKKPQLKKQENVKDLVSSTLQMSVCLLLWAQFF